MDIRKTVLSTVLASLVLGLAGPVIAEGESESRYDEVIKSKAHMDTILSLGVIMLALPHEREGIDPQVAQLAWYNHADAGLDERGKEIAAADMKLQLDTVSEVVEQHGLRRLSLIGLSYVGDLNNLDLYYAANTAYGPVIFRVSTYFDPAGPPRLFSLAVFKGWQACRNIMPRIEQRAGKKVLRVSYSGDAKPTKDDEPSDDEA